MLRALLALSLQSAAAPNEAPDTAAPPTRPNFIVVLADDLGSGDVRALNPDSRIPTPALDRLAAEGMTFTDAHSGSAVCTPTRYGLLTGRYCWRTRLKRGVLNGYGAPLIEPGRPTLASVLGTAGYTTGIVGKWHLGLGFARDGEAWDFSQPVSDGPHTHGFQHSFVIPASLDFPPYLYVQDGVVRQAPTLKQTAQKFPAYLRQGPRSPDLVMEDCLDDLLEEALRFVRREAETPEPFFLYFPLTAPHKPVLPHPRFRGRTELGPYADFVVQVDDTLGRLLAGLEECGIADDTCLVFTSDNGSFMFRRPDEKDHVADPGVQAYHPDHHRANGPWRGTKADVWEAGHRVPFFCRWPARVEAGARCANTICLTDVFSTLAGFAGVALSEGASPDGSPFLDPDTARPTARRAPVVHHSASGLFAIRRGPWKLVAGNGSGGREAPKGKPFERPYQLYHLGEDPGETQDRIESEAAIAAELEDLLEQIRNHEDSSR